MAENVELPGRLAILPFRNKVLLPGAIVRIRCTSSYRSPPLSLCLYTRAPAVLVELFECGRFFSSSF